MPAKPTWFLRLPAIVEQLRGLEAPFIDRDTVERTFRLRRRRAIDLMKHFDGYQIGKTFLVDKAQVVRALERLIEGDEFAFESRRKARVAEALEQARQEMAGRQIHIPASRDVLDRRIPDLPPAIHIRPGELRIEFSGAEDLLRNLLELSQAIMNDYARFQSLVEETGSIEADSIPL